MTNHFWDGFEKRAFDWTKAKSAITGFGQKAKSLFDQHVAGPAAAGFGVAKPHLEQGGQQFLDGLKAGLHEYGKNAGKSTMEYIQKQIEHVGKNVLNPAEAIAHLQRIGEEVGFLGRNKGLLERAGDVVKKHPYLTGGGAALTAAGGAYALGRSGNAPQQPQGGQGYQYYNPYY